MTGWGKGLQRTLKVLPRREKSALHISWAQRTHKNFHAQPPGPPFPTALTWEERRRGPRRGFPLPPRPTVYPFLAPAGGRPLWTESAGSMPSSRRHCGLTSLEDARPSASAHRYPSPRVALSIWLLPLVPVTSPSPGTCRPCRHLWK